MEGFSRIFTNNEEAVIMMDERTTECKELIKLIVEQTKLGLLNWECFEYLPLGIMDEDVYDETPAYISHSLELKAMINGLPYELSITEKITLPDGSGDVFITLTKDCTDDFMQIDEGLSLDYDYSEYTPDKLAEKYNGHPAKVLADILVPQHLDSNAVTRAMTWARYYNEVDVDKKYGKNKLNKLCLKLFNEHRLLDFHRIVLDMEYRRKLMM